MTQRSIASSLTVVWSLIVAERAVYKSRVPRAGAIPRGPVNFALGGLAGFVDVPSVSYTASHTIATSELGQTGLLCIL